MKRLCFGSLMTVLYQARNQKITNNDICDAIFKCYGYSVDSFDASTLGHLKSGKINIPPDIMSAVIKSTPDEADAAYQKHLIPLIKVSEHEAVVRAIKDILKVSAKY